MAGEIERRLLVNYRVDPALLDGLLPPQLRPQRVSGLAVAGICLIRLGGLRPRGMPSRLGFTTENAAHRIAVEWDEGGTTRTGVFIPRRDTSSHLTQWLGGRLFPGVHRHARFRVEETDERIRVAFTATDGTAVDVTVSVEPSLTGSRLFADADRASQFFEQGAVGLSPARDPSRLEAVRLTTTAWRIEPCRVLDSRSTFFEDTARFPAGAVDLDSALVMRKVPVRWDALPSVTAGVA
jgi:hypothetical protein